VIWVIVALVAALCLVAGYSARQLQEEREKDAKIEEQRAEIESMRGKPSMIETLSRENDELRAENRTLRRSNADHESNLEMVLDKLGDEPEPESE
jgi:predicted RNase H-like nuclease (RuvC/YqgF family)